MAYHRCVPGKEEGRREKIENNVFRKKIGKEFTIDHRGIVWCTNMSYGKGKKDKNSGLQGV
jgi:hypothetical protein